MMFPGADRSLTSMSVAMALLAASHRARAIEDAVAVPPLVQGHVRAIALDPAGNRYVAGFFHGEVDFNPGAGLNAKTSAGESDLFVTRFNADGSYAWTQTFGGPGADSAASVVTSKTAVYVAGRIEGAASDADAVVLGFNAATGAPLAKFGRAGVQTFGGTGEDEATALALAGPTLFVAGGFTSTDATLGGAGAFASAGGEDAFVVALHATNGRPLASFGKRGVQTLAGLNLERATGLVVQGQTLFVSGYASADSTGIGGLGAYAGLGGLDAFALALNRVTGKPRRNFGLGGLQFIGGTGSDLALGIAATKTAVYLAGTFDSEDAGIGASGPAQTGGGFDAFVASISAATGAANPFFGLGGIQNFGGSNSDAAAGVVVSSGRVHVAGAFTSMNAGLGGTGTLTAAGGGDAFVLHLHPFTGGAFAAEVQVLGGTAEDGAFAAATNGTEIFAGGSMFSDDVAINGTGSLDAIHWNGFLRELAPPPADPTAFDHFDSDGDDFPDELEAALGTSPVEFLSTPIGREPGPPLPLLVRKLTIKLDFTTPERARDQIILRGKFAAPPGFKAAGQPVAICVGGVLRTFVLDVRGRAAASDGVLSLRIKNQEAEFSAALRRGSFRAQLDDEGLIGDAAIPAPGAPRSVTVALLLGGAHFVAETPVTYTAITQQKGSATAP